MASLASAQHTVITSASDTRKYRYLKLPNELSVLLISDRSTDVAAAAMSVGVGYYCDPESLPGVAHFCEHMLFMGTEKYPNENEYSSFLAEHGGGSNAYTSSEHTNYYFQVSQAHLEPSLDRFAQFFIAPMFAEGSTERELEAVNSEHEKNIQSDVWRLQQLFQTTCNKGHPNSKFGTGSKETLQTPATRDALLSFHNTYYSANVMHLCVLGSDSLDVLEEMVSSMFSPITNTGAQIPTFSDSLPWGEEEKGEQLFTVPIKDTRRVDLSFQFPSLKKEYRKDASGYISHLLGDEGPGSILSVLKANGWALELMAGLTTHTKSFSMMGVSIELTEDGIDHVTEVVGLVFQYIHIMREATPQKWIWDEMKTINDINFRFLAKSSPASYVSTLASSMDAYAPEDIVCGRYLTREYDEKLIGDLMASLSPHNCRVVFIGQKYEHVCNQEETWYGTPFKRELIPADFISKWASPTTIHPDLHLPAKNLFIASDFSLRRTVEGLPFEEEKESVTADPAARGSPPVAPHRIRNDSVADVWFKQDNVFQQPKLGFFVDLVTPLAYSTVKNCVMTDIFAVLVKDAINEFTYSAEVAGLCYDVYNTVDGLRLIFQGYNDKMPVLVGRVAETMSNLIIREERFAVLQEKRRLSYKNFEKEQPYQWASYNAAHALRTPRWHNSDKLVAVESTSMKDVQDFIPLLLSDVKVRALVHGNATEKEALALVEGILGIVKKSNVTNTVSGGKQRIVCLPPSSSFVYSEPVHDAENVNSAIQNYYQVGKRTHRESACLSLLASILDEPCFDQLRTKQQLGYIVWSGTVCDEGVLGLRIIVQSGKCSPVALDMHIEAFLSEFRGTLKNMSEEDFVNHRDSLIIEKIKKPKRMREESYAFLDEIDSNTYVFDRTWKEANELDHLSLDDVLSMFDSHVANDSKTRRKLSVQLCSVSCTSENDSSQSSAATVVEDLNSFKRSMALHPVQEVCSS